MQVVPAPRAAREIGVVRPRALAGVPVGVGQRRPVVLADRVRLDEHVVPVLLGVARDPERQVAARAAGQVDRARQPLVRDVRDLRVRVVRARVRIERAARPHVLRGRPALELRVGLRGQDPAGRDERGAVVLVVRARSAERPRQAAERILDAQRRRRASRSPSCRRRRCRGTRRGSTAGSRPTAPRSRRPPCRGRTRARARGRTRTPGRTAGPRSCR